MSSEKKECCVDTCNAAILFVGEGLCPSCQEQFKVEVAQPVLEILEAFLRRKGIKASAEIAMPEEPSSTFVAGNSTEH